MLWLMLLLLMIMIPTFAAVAIWLETRGALEPAGSAELVGADSPLPERGA